CGWRLGNANREAGGDCRRSRTRPLNTPHWEPSKRKGGSPGGLPPCVIGSGFVAQLAWHCFDDTVQHGLRQSIVITLVDRDVAGAFVDQHVLGEVAVKGPDMRLIQRGNESGLVGADTRMIGVR